MKWLIRVLVALVVLVAVLLGAAAWLLPRLAESEQVRARIEQAAYDALGRELVYETLSFGVLPPSLQVVGARLAGATAQEPALLEAREVSLRVALLPLLARSVLVDSLVVEGARVHLVRTSEGLMLPEPPGAAGGAAGAEGAAQPEPVAQESEGEGASVSLAVRRVALRDSSITLEDRAVTPTVRWELRDIEATARGRALDEPIALELAAQLGSGGSIEVEGAATTAGALDLMLHLDEFAVAPLRPYLGADVSRLEGALSGDVKVVGTAPAFDELSVDLEGQALAFEQGDVTLAGPASVKADLATPSGAPQGPFSVDATGARIGMGGTFTKPPGTPARVTGRLAPAEGGGVAVEDVKLVIKNLDARGRIGSLSPLRLELSTPEPFGLEGWEVLVPALAEAPLSGGLQLQDLAYRAEPASLTGAVLLRDVVTRLPDSGPLVLRGALRASGTDIRGEDLTLETGGETATLDVALLDVFTAPHYRVAVDAKDADTNQILASLLGKPDTVYGPLGLDADLSGTLGDDPLRSLEGRIDFGIQQGRLVGVSFLRAVFDQLGRAGSIALDLGRAFGGRDLQRFYGDEFQVLSGVLDISGGVARTDDLKLEYRGYGVALRGQLGLEDLSLDMTGALAITPELDAVIAKGLGLSRHQASARVVPLAAVGGTLGAPKIRLADSAAPTLALAYAGEQQVDKLRQQVEKELGSGTGEVVDQGLQALEGLLGGGRKRPAPAETPAPPEAPAEGAPDQGAASPPPGTLSVPPSGADASPAPAAEP